MITLILIISSAALVLSIFMALSAMDLIGEAVGARLRSALIVGLLAGLSLTNGFTLASQVDALQAQNEAYSVLLDKRNQQISDLRGQVSAKGAQLVTSNAKYEIALHSNEALTKNLQEAHVVIKESKDKVEALGAKYAKLKAEKRVDAKQYKAMKAKYEEAKGVLQEIKGVTQ